MSKCNSLDSSFDTQLVLYSGGCGELTCLEANDDYCGKLSSLSWISIPDKTYCILVIRKSKQMGSFNLYLDQSKGRESCSFYAIPSPSDPIARRGLDGLIPKTGKYTKLVHKGDDIGVQ
jgi:hypothetical protein